MSAETVQIIGLRGQHVYVCRASSGSRCGGVRGDITGYSEASARRLRQYLASAETEYTVAATLTVPSWHPGADDCAHAKGWLRAWVERYRRRVGTSNCNLAWVMERQACGSIHFHVVCDRYLDHEWLAESWAGVVDCGDDRHRQAGTEVHRIRSSVSAYLAKYLTKGAMGAQQGLDRCRTGRWWGVVGDRRTVEAELRVQGAPEEAENPASERVMADFRAVMAKLVDEGRASPVEIVRDGHPVVGLELWRVPHKGVRRVIRCRMLAWRVECHGVYCEPEMWSMEEAEGLCQ